MLIKEVLASAAVMPAAASIARDGALSFNAFLASNGLGEAPERGRPQHRATGPYDLPSPPQESIASPRRWRHPKRQPTVCRHGAEVDNSDNSRSRDLGFRR